MRKAIDREVLGYGRNERDRARRARGRWARRRRHRSEGASFYTLAQASFGFQAGADATEVVILAMTERGLIRLLSSSVKLGGDVSAAVGPVGRGVGAGTAGLSSDLIVYSEAKGLYGGFSVDGAVLTPRDGLNEAYYGQSLSPTDIVIKGAATNPGTTPLLTEVAKAASAK